MQQMISDFFSKDVELFIKELAQLEQDIPAEATPADDDLLARLTEAIATSATACERLEQQLTDEEDLLKLTQQRFRDAIAPWFDRSWFMERAKNKPRGYPGDYETLTGIYNDVPRNAGFGGYLDLYFLNTSLAVAVKKRLAAARQFLLSEAQRRQEPPRFLNVACGPCREYTHGWDTNGKPASVTLVDMDPQALAFVEGRLCENNIPGLTFETQAYNALRMGSVEKNVEKFGRPDVIYSVGLCDYIPDNFMIRILRGWRESLAENGIVYVAFKDCQQYNKTEYAWHVDWHFVPRTEADCRRLFFEAGYNMDQLEMARSESPVIMNFVSRTAAESSYQESRETVTAFAPLTVD